MNNIAVKHWRLEQDESGVATLIIDHADSGVNVLSNEVMEELAQLLTQLEQQSPTGLIICSGKSSGFFAGADVKEFQTLTDSEAVRSKLEKGHQLFSRIQQMPCPTVALIHGHCLGGGLELALACQYRIADSASDCKLGLPEVKLGIHPGYGGVVRLSNLINPFQALTLMMAGRVIDSKKAKRLGIIDFATDNRYLMDAARKLALGIQKPQRKVSLISRLLAFTPARIIAAKLAYRELNKKINPNHYPAPYRLLRLWQTLPRQQSAALRAEIDSFISLTEDTFGQRAISNLVRIFLLDSDIKAHAKSTQFEGRRVHVIGAGIMGGDIAAWCALRGFKVTLQDAKAEYIGPAIGRAYKLFSKKLKRIHLVAAAMDRIVPDLAGQGVATADIIIEAISENLEAKKNLYAQIESKMKAEAILATNTSSIPLEDLSVNLQQPDRLVGVHFFNPVAMMQLVEVVRGENTSERTLNTALAFVNSINKLPLEVASAPGFLVNRVLMAYLAEAMRLFEEGVPAEVIDAKALNFGMPMGPIELSDTVGLDICQAVSRELMAHFGGVESELLQQMLDQGKLGRKSGQGFYRWEKGKAVKDKKTDVESYSQDVSERMIFSMLNECVQCLADGVVADADALDMGMIFGTGFPPFLGGPMQHIQAISKESCMERLNTLAAQGLDRFKPKPGWDSI